jgi:hypothetical protein
VNSAVRPLDATPQETGQECVLRCHSGWCLGGQRDAYWPDQNDPNAEYGAGAHISQNCFPGICDVEHPECEPIPPFAVLDDLEESLLEGDRQGVRGIMNRYKGQFVLNEERSAVQLISCDRWRIAHLSAPASLVGALSE